jgi:hypothetical protein
MVAKEGDTLQAKKWAACSHSFDDDVVFFPFVMQQEDY